LQKKKKYSGIRLLINTKFDTIKQTLQVDIGFGDVITPAPLSLLYPTLLDGLEQPNIMAYSIETSIAEKFEAMIYLGDFNSRMKDFYDVYVLLNNNKIEDRALQEAILQTFKQRGTLFVADHSLFSEVFANNPNRIFQWKHFLKKIKAPDLDFPFVVKTILNRLQPIYNELLNSN